MDEYEGVFSLVKVLAESLLLGVLKGRVVSAGAPNECRHCLRMNTYVSIFKVLVIIPYLEVPTNQCHQPGDVRLFRVWEFALGHHQPSKESEQTASF
jgi:hypothetical protein